MSSEDSDSEVEFPNLHRQLAAAAAGKMAGVYSPEDLKGMEPKVAALLVEQETVRQALEHELRLRELEVERELETNRLELQRLQNEAQQNSQRLGQETEGHVKGPKVPKITEKDDNDVYLCSSERLTTVHRWDRGTWATRLAANLSGKTLEACARMSAEDSSDYDRVRTAILNWYELTGETYRKKFRYNRKEHNETFKEGSVKLTGYFNRWLEVEKIFEFKQLHETLIMDQLLNACSPELRIWLEERYPKKLEDMVQLADHYLVSHRKSDRQEKKGEGEKFF